MINFILLGGRRGFTVNIETYYKYWQMYVKRRSVDKWAKMAYRDCCKKSEQPKNKAINKNPTLSIQLL